MLVYLTVAALSVTTCACVFEISRQWSSGLVELHLSRILFAAAVSLIITAWGLRRKSLSTSGAILGFFVGFVHTLASYCFQACLFAFFVTSSKATRFRCEKKRKLESDYREGGQRNWIQVLCNGGVSTQAALLYLLHRGPGEEPLQLLAPPTSSLLATSLLCALAAANGDTWASELGSVTSRTPPRLIVGFKTVPVGTNGGFTNSGLLFSALGGAVVGLSYFLSLLASGVTFSVPSQAFLLILIGASSGLFGSVLDSVIGATLQYSGVDIRTGKVVETPGIGVKHISGFALLNNHSVNLLTTSLTAVIVPIIITHACNYFS